jgi:C4-dicarboxylate transporter DctQ subunit
MSVIVFAQILSRFVFHASFAWSEEITRYLLVWTTFFGGAYCVRKGAHVGIEAFTMLLPKKAKKILAIIVMVGGIFLCVVILKFSMDLTTTLFSRNQLSPAMRIPIAYAYLAVPVGIGLFIVRYIQNIFIAVRDFNKDDGAAAGS